MCSFVSLGLPCRRSSEDPVRQSCSTAATTRPEGPGDSGTRSSVIVGRCLHFNSVLLVCGWNIFCAVHMHSFSCRPLAWKPLSYTKTMSLSWCHVKDLFVCRKCIFAIAVVIINKLWFTPTPPIFLPCHCDLCLFHAKKNAISLFW